MDRCCAVRGVTRGRRRRSWPVALRSRPRGAPRPHVSAPVSSKRWFTVAIFFGVTVKACNGHVGSRIKTGGSRYQVFDAHGHNLLPLTHSLGGGTSTLFNSIISVVSQCLERAGVKTRSKGVNNRATHIFKGALSGGHPLGKNGNIQQEERDHSRYDCQC